MGNLSVYNRTAGGGKSAAVLCCICHAAPRPYARDFRGNAIGRCPECGLRFVSPRPPMEAFLRHTYDEDYYGLGNGSRRSQPQDCGGHLARLQHWARPPGRLLDIGSGDGTLLRAAKAAGWLVEGVEMRQQLADRFLADIGCPIHVGGFEEFKPSHQFDAVTLIHVLEHVPDPMAFLRKCRAALKEGGVAYLAAPNTASLNDRIKTGLSRGALKRSRWKHLAADHHLWFFTPATMRRLCRQAGFEVLALATTHPSRKAWPGWLLRGMARLSLGPWLAVALRK
ncbi:MAG: methyltransferase domain-containing protein [Elusimicrobia bacterium]|nr:methyltransferase domain-containing protein [Elusimicrobiota bacterium]